MGAYISLSSEIGGRALIGAWALKGRNMVPPTDAAGMASSADPDQAICRGVV